VIYVDSTILLEVYLGQPRASSARQILADPGAKVSSWIMAVEVPIVLRRALARQADSRLLAACLGRFDSDLGGISLFDGLPDVAGRIRTDVRLARCRAIDAVHVATAMLLAEETALGLRMATFDRRLAETAGSVGIPVLP
jgi:predicted nucleic acid-binding protein